MARDAVARETPATRATSSSVGWLFTAVTVAIPAARQAAHRAARHSRATREYQCALAFGVRRCVS